MRTQNAGVIGHPIGHTMSPFLQKRLFELAHVPMDYQVLDVPDLKEAMPKLQAFDCFNVTIPHKSAIIPFLSGLDEKAAACGSVNTVKVKDGKLYGTTTDGAGCFQALQRHGLDFSGEVLLLGNGGAARALAFEVAQRQKGFRLTIACRGESYEKAQKLGEELADFARGRGDGDFLIAVEKYEELELDTKKRFSLLLNATSVGMTPNVGASPVTEKVVARCEAVFDAVYNPRETELLRLAGLLGKKAVGGMEMLVFQAAEAFAFWYGTSFREEDLIKLCEDAQKEMDRRFGNLVLCGFMGSGKTTVGKRAAALLGRKFCDLDQYIEEREGMTVSQIFEKFGEAGFREREAQAVLEVSKLGGMVVACGGGTVLAPQNVEAFHAQGGLIVLLDVPLPILQARLKNDKQRPLLQKPNRRQVIEELYKKRLPQYRAAADVTVKAAAALGAVARRVAELRS